MAVNKGLVVLVEDLKENRDVFKSVFEAAKLNEHLQLEMFSSVTDFVAFCGTDVYTVDVRVLVFDLANDTDEANEGGTDNEFAIAEYIRANYEKNRVPIFVHSAYIHKFDEFDKSGTVFKIEKSDESVEQIINIIKLMESTGFLELFCKNGVLEKKHPDDLHKVFTSQFRKNELPELLKLFKECHGADCTDRITDVFQRMSLRALINTYLAANINSSGEPNNPKVNVIEHFYRRTNFEAVAIWTGDIMINKSDGSSVFVMTPRCNLANLKPEEFDKTHVLWCPIRPYEKFNGIQATHNARKAEDYKKTLKDAINHNPMLGIRMRVIPPSPFYPGGGSVWFSEPQTTLYTNLAADYEYLVTLSDDFIADISARFSSYLMRPGIADINVDELYMQF